MEGWERPCLRFGDLLEGAGIFRNIQELVWDSEPVEVVGVELEPLGLPPSWVYVLIAVNVWCLVRIDPSPEELEPSSQDPPRTRTPGGVSL